jgi:hypothetical protein
MPEYYTRRRRTSSQKAPLSSTGSLKVNTSSPRRASRFTGAHRVIVLEDYVADRVCVEALRRGSVLLARFAFQTARLILLNVPGGFERMFELAPKTVDDAVSALRKYGVEVVGPHPREKRHA